MALLLICMLLAIFNWLGKAHRLVAAGATLIQSAVVPMGLKGLRGDSARRLPVHQGINLALLTVFTGVAVAAFRAFSIFGMPAGIRKWWAGRQARKLQMTPDAERGEI